MHAAQKKIIVLVPEEETLDAGPKGAHTSILTYVEPGVIMGT